MRKRLSTLKGIIDDYTLRRFMDTPYDAVNIGVMGFNKKGLQALNIWADLTAKLAGKHIADEIAAHYLLQYATTYIADNTYNESAKLGNLEGIEKCKVVHYHGGSQGGGDVDIRYEDRRRSSRLWLAYLQKMYKENIIPDLKQWEQYATGGIEVILKNNRNLLDECYREFIK
jgi:hypothetical protein